MLLMKMVSYKSESTLKASLVSTVHRLIGKNMYYFSKTHVARSWPASSFQRDPVQELAHNQVIRSVKKESGLCIQSLKENIRNIFEHCGNRMYLVEKLPMNLQCVQERKNNHRTFIMPAEHWLQISATEFEHGIL